MAESIVFNEDCIEVMKRYPDNHFDLAVVDPPYGIGGDSGIQKNEGKFGFKKHRKTNWDVDIPNAEYWEQLFRVSKNQIVWGGNYFTKYLPPKMCWLSWYKEQQDFSFSDFELAWTSFDAKCRQFNLIRGFDERGKHYSSNNGRIHPTQKPMALYDWIFTNYATEGMKILDTHLGSQSSRIAAYKHGLDFTGCEIDKEYFDAGCKRFEQFKAQLTLF
jgi:site-specific DNA-methyltransferase (adenine-specific)